MSPDLETDEWSLKRLMTEVVGSGHKSAEDMDRAQSREAMRRILRGTPDPTTLGAFWLANRWKRNTPIELAGFLDEAVEFGVQRGVPSASPVDCGAAYDGKHTTAILGVAAGAVSAAAGAPVVVHSSDRVPTQKLPVYKDVLDELGVRTEIGPEESARMVDETGFGFYYQPRFAPHIHALRDRRDQMGVRTFINTVETLVNPAEADVHLGSFFHLAFAKRIVQTVQESDTAGVERVIMFQGLEGYDDIRLGSTKVAEYEPTAGLTDYAIESADYGMDFASEDLEVENVATDSATITEGVLARDRDGPFVDAALLNAALRIYAGGAAPSIGEGLSAARSALADGRAAAVLEEMQEF